MRVGLGEFAVQDDGDPALAHLVTVRPALHAQHADVGLAVALSNECHDVLLIRFPGDCMLDGHVRLVPYEFITG